MIKSNTNTQKPLQDEQYEQLISLLKRIPMESLSSLTNQPQPQFMNDTQMNTSSLSHADKPRDSYLRRLRLLPVFDGENYKSLRSFLDVTKVLNDSWINDSEKLEFIETINLQLRGEARNVVGNLYESDYERMKNKLLKQFVNLQFST